MIHHIVLFKLKDYLSSAEKQEAAERVRAELLSMRVKIEVIREFEVGINKGENPSAYDVSILSSFCSWDDLEIYQFHPSHKAFIAFNKSYTVHKAIIDYEV